jgi:hypothetical protein
VTIARTPLAVLATVIASVCIASTVSASPNYPLELQAALNLYYVPKCTLCHSTGSGPVDTPFGKSMVARGLLGEAADSGVYTDGGIIDPTLLTALQRMRADGVDSVGDGTQDLDKLTWGGDPNHFDGLAPTSTQQMHYGCQLGRHSASNTGAIAAMLGTVLVIVERRDSKALRPTNPPLRHGSVDVKFLYTLFLC